MTIIDIDVWAIKIKGTIVLWPTVKRDIDEMLKKNS